MLKMYFWLQIFYITLMSLQIKAESRELIFNVLAVGHSGLLISWDYSNIQDANDTSFQIDFLPISSPSSQLRTTIIPVTTKQYQIFALNENTEYQINISHVFYDENDDRKVQKKYSLTGRTTRKTNGKPEKPDFEWNVADNYDSPAIRVLWLPCGKDRKCAGKVLGTHFFVQYTMEGSTELLKTGDIYRGYFILNWLLPGKKYKVTVTSVNGDFHTESDPADVFITPVNITITSVKTMPLSDTSLLISWNSYSESDQPIFQYFVSYVESNLSQNTLVNDTAPRSSSYYAVAPHLGNYSQTIVRYLKTDTRYVFFIVPVTLDHAFGSKFSFDYILHPLKQPSNTPLAKPEIRYKIVKTFNARKTTSASNTCNLVIQWLPCGQMFDCKNSKPGLGFYLQIKNENTGEIKFKNEIARSDFWVGKVNENQTYDVLVESVHDRVDEVSEAVLEKIKISTCSAW